MSRGLQKLVQRQLGRYVAGPAQAGTPAFRDHALEELAQVFLRQRRAA